MNTRAAVTIILFALVGMSSSSTSDVLSTPSSWDAVDELGSPMDAYNEAAYTLAAFSIAAFFVQLIKHHRKKAKSRRVAKLKAEHINVASESVDSSTRPAYLVGHSGSSCILQPERERRTDGCCVAAVSRASNRAPAVVRTDHGGEDAERDALAAAVRAGRAHDLPWLLKYAREDAKARGLHDVALQDRISKQLLSSLRACAARRCFREAIQAYDSTSEYIGGGCKSTWSLLLYSAVETQEFDRCDFFFIRLLRFKTVECNDFINMVRVHAFRRDIIGFRCTLKCLEEIGFNLDVFSRNRALSACTSYMALGLAEVIAFETSTPMDSVGYNTLMKGCTQAGQPTRCFELYGSMQKDGIAASDMTFGILLEACINANDIDRAKCIFEDLRSSGTHLNVVHCTTFIKALACAGQLEDAMVLLMEMQGSATAKPDLVTYSTLVKAFADHGRVMDTMRVLEQMLNHGILPDNIIFNTMLTGCTVRAMEPQKIFHVLRWLCRHGLKMSTTTLSIVVKALAKTKSWDEALDLLDYAMERFSIRPELRLYAQLAQACARENAIEKAAEVYGAMLHFASTNGIPVDAATNSRLHRICCWGKESNAVTNLYNAVAKSGGYLKPGEVSAMLVSNMGTGHLA